MEDKTRSILAYSNPIIWPVAVGVFVAVVVKNLFSGVYKDCKKIASDI